MNTKSKNSLEKNPENDNATKSNKKATKSKDSAKFKRRNESMYGLGMELTRDDIEYVEELLQMPFFYPSIPPELKNDPNAKPELTRKQKKTIIELLKERKTVETFNVETMFAVYKYFCITRIIGTLMPQQGYLHPDEFFQSIEVFVGETFDVDYNRPWEFNRTNPIRGAAIPLLTVGLPLKLLKFIGNHIDVIFGKHIPPTPYFLIVFPRLTYALSSFLVDYSLYRVCCTLHLPYKKYLFFLSTSYIMSTYATHTFSNTIEMVLMSLLLYIVVDTQFFSYDVISDEDYYEQQKKDAVLNVERARWHKLKLLLPSHTLRNLFKVSLITVTGFFNRPTFLIYSLIPVFFWLYRGLGCRTVRSIHFHFRMTAFLVISLLLVFVFVLIDSFYYGYISIMEIVQLDVSLKNFVVTPFNFIMYNLNASNLAEHGLHSRWTHVFVNIPLLYNVMGLMALVGIVMVIFRLIHAQFTQLPRINSLEALFVLSAWVPIIGLSYFPHQEPRFLIPVILPILFLHSDFCLKRTWVLAIWAMFNGCCLVFYGFFHQAGMYPSAFYLHGQVGIAQEFNRPIHMVTSHMYSYPLSLLQHRNSMKVYGSGSNKYKKPKVFFLQEMGSTDLDIVGKHLSVIYKVTRNQETPPRVKLLIPNVKYYEIDKIITNHNLTLQRERNFYFHFSSEAGSEYVTFILEYMWKFDALEFFFKFMESLSLGLYEIKHPNDTSQSIYE